MAPKSNSDTCGDETVSHRPRIGLLNSLLKDPCLPHPVRLRVVEEVGPVGVSLHVPELKQLPEAQHQDVLADLKQGENVKKNK